MFNLHFMKESLTLFVTAMLLVSGHSMEESLFVKDSICDVQKRIDEGCSREVTENNLLSCLNECGRDIFCIGASLEKRTGKCFFHNVCSPSTRYVTQDTDHDYYSRYCVHGRWHSGARLCTCSFGTFGGRCEKAYQTSNAFLGQGYSQGNHIVYLDPKQDGDLYRVRVYILNRTNRTQIYLARNTGKGSFNRTWHEYLIGFGATTFHDYWIGLKAWNVFSNLEGCFTTIASVDLENGERFYRIYKHFIVQNRESNYSFTFQHSNAKSPENVSPNHSFGECMKVAENISFTTWDRDDDVTKNCPLQLGYGWWHAPDCNNTCNFLSWGLQDWNNTSRLHRFSVLGLDKPPVATQITRFRMYLKCQD